MQSARFDHQLDEFSEVSSDGGVGRKYQEGSKGERVPRSEIPSRLMQSARFDQQLDEFLEVSSVGGVGRKFREGRVHPGDSIEIDAAKRDSITSLMSSWKFLPSGA